MEKNNDIEWLVLKMEADLEREKSISLDADLNEKRISEEKNRVTR